MLQMPRGWSNNVLDMLAQHYDQSSVPESLVISYAPKIRAHYLQYNKSNCFTRTSSSPSQHPASHNHRKNPSLFKNTPPQRYHKFVSHLLP
ncbi:hypothetical protein M758_7G072800 [Ceratodon purpureus]|uniref:Uncharacterized protein n=1 Tax=Ceratodon purpureus TaxID=3225 RepID=A0A8T0H6Y5_CERPU|nr:hypothetical protein KC19_7G071600 [Ceratodon purpureus]KAG0610530.1 hypothetical protein M758_7G072800 [Ceratodon purpureus]